MRIAVGQVLRRRDTEDPTQPRNFRKDMAQRVRNPLANLRGARAHREVLRVAAIVGPFDTGIRREELRGHRARLIEIEIDFDPVILRAIHQPGQILQPRLPTFAEFQKDFRRRQSSQHGLQPNAIDSHPRQLVQDSVWERVDIRFH